MRQEKKKRENQKGNAVFFVLLGIILFAALGFAISRSSRAPAIDYSTQEAEIEFQEFIAYPTKLEQVVQYMIVGGISPDDIDFTEPGGAGFTTAPHGKKVFHPEGGGVEYREQTEAGLAPYVYNNVSEIYGLGTELADGGSEIIFAAEVTLERCREINLRLHGSNSIPHLASANLATLLAGGSTTVGGMAAGTVDIQHIKNFCVTDLTNGQPEVMNIQGGDKFFYAGIPGLFPRPVLEAPQFLSPVAGDASSSNEIYVYIHALNIR